MSTTTVTTATLTTPEVDLYYEVRGAGPLLALVGAPMDARPFEALAEEMAADWTVLTLDPRGINRSTLTSGVGSSPVQRAADLARLVTHLDAGRARVLGSSGGAVTSLAFAERHPELVATVIAHEPPLLELLEDRLEQRRLTEAMVELYRTGDAVGAWRMFFTQANLPVPDEMIDEMFGGERDPQDVADETFWYLHELPASVTWQPDLGALVSGGVRLVVGIGEESSGQICDRTSTALAAALGVEPVLFPGDHTGFADVPGAFAERLRAVLSD